MKPPADPVDGHSDRWTMKSCECSNGVLLDKANMQRLHSFLPIIYLAVIVSASLQLPKCWSLRIFCGSNIEMLFSTGPSGSEILKCERNMTFLLITVLNKVSPYVTKDYGTWNKCGSKAYKDFIRVQFSFLDNLSNKHKMANIKESHLLKLKVNSCVLSQ